MKLGINSILVWDEMKTHETLLKNTYLAEEDIMNKNKKLQFMNIAKGIGIILIVLGHSFSEDSTSPIRSFVYLFHVPLFFIISGYFFNDKYIKTPLKLIIRRIKSLWLPFFKWSLLFILLHNFFCTIKVYKPNYSYDLIDTIKNIIKLFLFKSSEQLLGGFWFIPALFFTVMIFLGLRLISEKIRFKYNIFLFSFLLFVLGNLLFFYKINIPLIPFKIKLYCVTTFIYSIGYAYRKYEDRIPNNPYLALLSLILLLVVNYFDFVKINSIYSVVGDMGVSFLYLVITPILGSYIVFYISKALSKENKVSIFEKIGERTMAILALHFISFKSVTLLIVMLSSEMGMESIAAFPVIQNHEKWFLAYLLSGILIPYLVSALSKKCSTYISPLFTKLKIRGYDGR